MGKPQPSGPVRRREVFSAPMDVGPGQGQCMSRSPVYEDGAERMVKKPIREAGPDLIAVSRHGAASEIGRRASDDLRSRVRVRSLGHGTDKLQPDGRPPRYNHQFTRRLGGSNERVHPTYLDNRAARHDAPSLGETTGRWTSLDDFAQHDNAQRIPSSYASGNFHQTE
jgi:hypothetical protein